MQTKTILFFLILPIYCFAQNDMIGSVFNEQEEAIAYANIALYNAVDSSLTKVEVSDINGNFKIAKIPNGDYYLMITFIGYENLIYEYIHLNNESTPFNIGKLSLKNNTTELNTAIVSAERALVEIKPDKTIFNVQGTINSTGNNALDLLKKAPGLIVGSGSEIKVLGRTGVQLFVDGKRFPLTGEDLSDYLNNLPAEQIDRIEIISNPGVKYEAQGNAGIIDIRMKKNESLGSNASITSSISQGRRARGNISLDLNHRNKRFNTFGIIGYSKAHIWSDLLLRSTQNGFLLEEFLDYDIRPRGYNYKWGMDYFFHKNHTIGVMTRGSRRSNEILIDGSNEIGTQNQTGLDSILLSQNISTSKSNYGTYNVNYRFDNQRNTLSLDIDYGVFEKDRFTDQPNAYYTPRLDSLLHVSDKEYSAYTKIDIFTVKLDFEKEAFNGRIEMGSKFSKVNTQNEFLFSDIVNDKAVQNNFRSNLFDYDESVIAAYISYSKSFMEKWDLNVGSRLEQTFSVGNLQVFEESLSEPPFESEYLDIFPNASIAYKYNPKNTFNLSYSKRINRPNYRRLNPFKSQVNELGFDKGNPFLKPEYAHNIELGYTFQQRYNFKVAYSHVDNQIVNLIGPDSDSPKAGFLGYGNLASQDVYTLSTSTPFKITQKWNTFTNMTLSHTSNFADYGDEVIIDAEAFNFYIFQQHTFELPLQIKGELSFWYTGPGIWGGITYSESNSSLSAGLKKSFLNKKLNIRISVNDIFYKERFRGISDFNGRRAETISFEDSRRVSMSIRYKFGNNKVESNRRKTGMEAESKRTRG